MSGFKSPTFLGKGSGGGAGGALPIIHTSPSQLIQGGLPGEHYHLSKALYTYLLSTANNPLYPELVMTKQGALISASNGDIVLEWAAFPESLKNQFLDVISAANTIPVDPNSDPYWNNVVIMSYINEYISATNKGFKALDQYSSAIGNSGSDTQAVLQSTVKCFGRATLAILNQNAISAGLTAFLSLAQSKTSLNNSLPNLFTYEAFLAQEPGGLDTIRMDISQNPGPGSVVELIFQATSAATNNATIGTYNQFNPVQVSAPFTWHPTAKFFHHIVVERDASNVVHLYIDGVHKISLTVTDVFNAQCNTYADYFGPHRLTKGICRYSADFAPLTAPFPAK